MTVPTTEGPQLDTACPERCVLALLQHAVGTGVRAGMQAIFDELANTRRECMAAPHIQHVIMDQLQVWATMWGHPLCRPAIDHVMYSDIHCPSLKMMRCEDFAWRHPGCILIPMLAQSPLQVRWLLDEVGRVVATAEDHGSRLTVLYLVAGEEVVGSPVVEWPDSTFPAVNTGGLWGKGLTVGGGPAIRFVAGTVRLLAAGADRRSLPQAAIARLATQLRRWQTHLLPDGLPQVVWAAGRVLDTPPPPLMANEWLEWAGSPWERVSWLLESSEDSEFRAAHWTATNAEGAHLPDHPVPVQRRHLLPEGTSEPTASGQQLAEAARTTPRRATVRGGVPLAVRELVWRRTRQWALANAALAGLASEVLEAGADLWAESAASQIRLEKETTMRTQVVQAVARAAGQYQPATRLLAPIRKKRRR